MKSKEKLEEFIHSKIWGYKGSKTYEIAKTASSFIPTQRYKYVKELFAILDKIFTDPNCKNDTTTAICETIKVLSGKNIIWQLIYFVFQINFQKEIKQNKILNLQITQ